MAERKRLIAAVLAYIAGLLGITSIADAANVVVSEVSRG